MVGAKTVLGSTGATIPSSRVRLAHAAGSPHPDKYRQAGLQTHVSGAGRMSRHRGRPHASRRLRFAGGHVRGWGRLGRSAFRGRNPRAPYEVLMVLCGAGGGGCPNPSGAPKVVAPSAKRGETFRFESSFQTWHWHGLRVRMASEPTRLLLPPRLLRRSVTDTSPTSPHANFFAWGPY